MNLFDARFLFASLIWSSIGMGYWIYGKKSQSMIAMLAGVFMIAVSMVVPSVLLMSLICVALIVGVYMLLKRGF